jgi:hypothetical protein
MNGGKDMCVCVCCVSVMWAVEKNRVMREGTRGDPRVACDVGNLSRQSSQ